MSILHDGDDTTQPDRAPASSRAGDYVVVARRYRPQTFADLIGQEHIARALSGAITSNRVGHAYLFTGARGVGKTSAARILAKALNCEQGPSPTPCNQCDLCLSVSTGDDIDVLEIDGASNRGIDEIRELRQNVNIRPTRARFKIYIIDEVHMLTTPAFNALLKTLEEPPDRVKFIFCTTEVEKIPITILSRCQRFDFAGIETASIANRLKQIAAAEQIEAEPAALELLARRASGSMRDSQSLLEQLLAFGGRKISVADVHAMLGTAATGRVAALVEHLAHGEAAAVLKDLDEALSEGVDVSQLISQLVGFYRDVLVASVGGSIENLLFTGPSESDLVERVAAELGPESVLAIMQLLDHALGRMRYSTQPRVLAELALVRIARLENLTALTDLVQGVRQTPIPLAAAQLPPPPERIAAPRTVDQLPPPAAPPHPAQPPAATGVADDSPKKKPLADLPNPDPARPPLELTSENAAQIWQQATEMLQDTAAEFARCASRVELSALGKLVVTFPAQYSYNRTMCQRPEKHARLEQVVSELVGGPVKVEFELAANDPVLADKPPPARPKDRLAEVGEHPLVRKAIEVFGARPTRLEEPPG